MNDVVLANCSNLFCFRQQNASDIAKVARTMAFEKSAERNYIARLSIGECIARFGGTRHHRFPILIKTKDLPKTPFPDDGVGELASQWLKNLGAPLPESSKPPSAIPAAAPVSKPVPGFGGIKEPVHLGSQKAQAAGHHGGWFASKQEEYQACMAHLLNAARERPDTLITWLYSQLGLSKAKG